MLKKEDLPKLNKLHNNLKIHNNIYFYQYLTDNYLPPEQILFSDIDYNSPDNRRELDEFYRLIRIFKEYGVGKIRSISGNRDMLQQTSTTQDFSFNDTYKKEQNSILKEKQEEELRETSIEANKVTIRKVNWSIIVSILSLIVAIIALFRDCSN